MARGLSSSFHTIVVGAGPGGLACATTLAQHGKEVLLIDRRQEIGPKVCAGGVTWSDFHRQLPAGILEKSFNRQHIFSPAQQLTFKAPAPLISTVDRRKLGQWMLSGSMAAGVAVQAGVRALKIDGNHLETSAGRFAFRYLVGADGSNSLVRRHLGLETRDLGMGIHYLIPGEFARMEWHMDQKTFHNGYAWIFPRQGLASVGAYAVRSASSKNLHQGLRQWAKRRNIDLDSGPLQAALVNFDYRGWRFGNIFLVGDAAGLASGLTGEGIYQAVISGQEVASVIIDRGHRPARIERLIRKQQRHRSLLDFIKGNLACRFGIELFLLALRTRLVHFNVMKMGD
jgi:flavin-dependent dehydrogenase